MADRTLTINHADGGSETYTINRDKFAGVREMSRGHVYPTIAATNFNHTGVVFTKADEKTFTLVASNSTATRWINFISVTNGIRTGKHRMEFDLVLNSGSISSGFVWNHTDNDDDPHTGNSYGLANYPTVGHNSFDFEIFNDGVSPNPHVFFQISAGRTFDISVTNFKVTHEPDTVTVDHTAKPKAQSKETTFGGSKSITIKRDIEPLLSKVVGGASAAYSLRDLNDKANTSKVVRVRRESDNNERDFNAKEVSNGTLTTWVGALNDGFVETWYDQSGNGNDATQLTASYQPKIVDAGVLVTDRDGKGALNGKGANLDLPNDAPMLSADGTYSVFAVVDFDDQRNGNDDFNTILRFNSKTNGGSSSLRKPLIYLNQAFARVSATGPSYNQGSVHIPAAKMLSVQLLTNIANPALPTGNNTLYADGALVSSSDTATSVNTETLLGSYSQIFDSNETTVTHFLSEVIYYSSDQSANRPAIEANINNQYDIY